MIAGVKDLGDGGRCAPARWSARVQIPLPAVSMAKEKVTIRLFGDFPMDLFPSNGSPICV